MKDLRKFTRDILMQIGIPGNVAGFKYLVEAIRIAIDNERTLNSITKEIYPTIANIFNTKPSNVERSMRHAISISWSRERICALNEIFGARYFVENEKPTNSEFIALFADKVQDLMAG